MSFCSLIKVEFLFDAQSLSMRNFPIFLRIPPNLLGNFRLDKIPKAILAAIFFANNQTLEDNTVTIRDRDTMEQQRIKIEEIIGWIKDQLNV